MIKAGASTCPTLLAAAALFTWAAAPSLHAGARIDLRATPPQPPGGYAPDSTIRVDAFLVDQNTANEITPLLQIALDFRASSQSLQFPGDDGLAGNADDNRFSWNIIHPLFNATIDDLPYTGWWYSLDPPLTDQWALKIPSQGEVHIGHIVVDVGNTGGVLDVVNAPFYGPNLGAVVLPLYLLNVEQWTIASGDLSGGRLLLEVVPDVSTCVAFGIVFLAVLYFGQVGFARVM